MLLSQRSVWRGNLSSELFGYRIACFSATVNLLLDIAEHLIKGLHVPPFHSPDLGLGSRKYMYHTHTLFSSKVVPPSQPD